MQQLIEFHFELGLMYKDILTALHTTHGYSLSERQLKRVLCSRGLRPWKEYSNLDELLDFIRDQLKFSGQIHGWILEVCGKQDISIGILTTPRDSTLFVTLTHKLKPYGICINGHKDGFSGKMIWLNSYTSSKPPKNINKPNGRLNIMYAIPQLYRTTDFLSSVQDEDLQMCKAECIFNKQCHVTKMCMSCAILPWLNLSGHCLETHIKPLLYNQFPEQPGARLQVLSALTLDPSVSLKPCSDPPDPLSRLLQASPSRVDQSHLSGFGHIRVNRPHGEQKRRSASVEMQSGNPSAIV
ncbi:hypothetical protein N1851_002825 [Merluccius polli]|uniref:Uncharacterized protein n=1 Tax=Merluccius polli TaxID=89951 RepID=A0AA47NB84_MERPO|nr:hypothetical protein N1851_002825 [Merluccius polli]